MWIIIHLHFSFLCCPWEEAGQAWAHAAWMRQMPALGLWEYQPAPGNLLYTIPVAAEVVGEMRFGPFGWEALMAFPEPQVHRGCYSQGDPRGAAQD